MKTDSGGIFWRKILQTLAFFVAILILLLPIYFQYVLAIYQAEIAWPRAHARLVQDTNTLLAALDQFRDDKGYYPAELNLLVPSYLQIWPPTFTDFSYQYNRSENLGFELMVDVPSIWLGWPAVYACQRYAGQPTLCGYQYLCTIGRSEIEWLPTADTPSNFHFLDYLKANNPCGA